MDEARAQATDAVSVAIAGLDRRILEVAARLEAIIQANDRRYSELRTDDEKAVSMEVRRIEQLDTLVRSYQDKFENSIKDRFAQVNEFRGSLDDLGKTMATRRETETQFIAINSKIEEQAKSLNSRIDQNVALIGELRSRLDVGPADLHTIKSSVDKSSGVESGREMASLALARAIASAGALIGIAGVIIAIIIK